MRRYKVLSRGWRRRTERAEDNVGHDDRHTVVEERLETRGVLLGAVDPYYITVVNQRQDV